MYKVDYVNYINEIIDIVVVAIVEPFCHCVQRSVMTNQPISTPHYHISPTHY